MRAGNAPPWARVADAATIAFLCLALFVLFFGGFEIRLPAYVVRIRSAARLLFAGLALIALRHAAHPAAPLHRRLFSRQDGESGARTAILARAVASRLLVLLVAYVAVLTIAIPEATKGFEVSPDPAFNLPARFDAGWYGDIALNGYYFGGAFGRQQNIAFFPAFPMLMRAAGYPLGAFAPGVSKERRLGRVLWAGTLLSILAFAWAAVYLWRLARDVVGEPNAPAAVMLLAAYPFAVFYSAAYSESLFLLGCVAAIYHFRRDQLVAAALWGALVGFTRPNGCFLSVVLALLALQASRRRGISKFPDFQISKWLAASTPGLAMLAFSAYMNAVTGQWFGWARTHEAWGRSYQGLAPMSETYRSIVDEGFLHVVQRAPYTALNAVALVFVLLMVWPVARRLGVAFAAFILVNAIPPLLAGGVLSMGRLTSTLFPVFLALAAIVSPRIIPALVTGFALGQGLVAMLFFTWRPLY